MKDIQEGERRKRRKKELVGMATGSCKLRKHVLRMNLVDMPFVGYVSKKTRHYMDNVNRTFDERIVNISFFELKVVSIPKESIEYVLCDCFASSKIRGFMFGEY